MRNDLISRSAVIAIIENKRLSTGKRDLSTEYALADVQEKIEKLKTAYDVDKVVEQICGCDGCSGCCNCHEEEKMLECEEYVRVYGIVKAGGLNEKQN